MPFQSNQQVIEIRVVALSHLDGLQINSAPPHLFFPGPRVHYIPKVWKIGNEGPDSIAGMEHKRHDNNQV
jgi:hypothetical protein